MKKKKSSGITLSAANTEALIKKIKKSTREYTASIKVLGKIYTATGTSLREAIEELTPEKGKGVSILTISKGGMSKERVLNFGQTFRLFSASKLMREVALKNTCLLFDL